VIRTYSTDLYSNLNFLSTTELSFNLLNMRRQQKNTKGKKLMSIEKTTRSERKQVTGAEAHLNSIHATAKKLGVSPFTIRRLIRDGALKGVRVGRRLLVSQRVIDDVMENGCARP
jgi:excisionase family DNA binding protein